MLATDRACDGHFLATRRYDVWSLIKDHVFWHDAPRKYTTLRYSVVRDDKTGKFVLLSQTNDMTIRMVKYCTKCFSVNINHRIFIHQIFVNISRYQYVDSYILS